MTAIKDIQHTIGNAITLLEFLQTHEELFKDFTYVWVYAGVSPQIEVHQITRGEFRKLMKAFPGKWRKELYYDNKSFVYTKDVDDVRVRASKVEAPPRCYFVEETVEIPAQPARTEVRKVLKCK